MTIVLIRTRLRADADVPVHDALNDRVYELVQQIPGFLGIKSFVAEDGDSISSARFSSADALAAWKQQPDHVVAQRRGREEFFASYEVEVCEVTRSYDFVHGRDDVRTDA